MNADDDWQVAPGAVDDGLFVVGRLGPYRLGPTIRRTAFGELLLAVDEPREALVELDMLDSIGRTRLIDPDGKIMTGIAPVVGLQHRHLAAVIGTGVGDGTPYVVRPHRLGRTLAELLERAEMLPIEVCAALVFAVADALAFLEQQGPQPGSCSMGGFDARDVFIGYDGRVELTGTGLQLARDADAPIEADLRSSYALVRELDASSGGGLISTVASATRLEDLAVAVRRKHREACGALRRYMAQELRKHFAAEIQDDRAFFGLRTLQ